MNCEASLVDGLGDQEVRSLFDAARDADYTSSWLFFWQCLSLSPHLGHPLG
jgi:hypothetical protein